MVTAGDIEFEQEQTKIFVLTKSVIIMVAGDLTVQADILHSVIEHKNRQLNEYPDEWLSVKLVADWFYEDLAAITRQRAAKMILHPLNLDFDKLVLAGIDSELANQLAKELLDFRIAPIQAIVMGIDASGAHIYEVSNEGVVCQDWTGFASIGAGAWHANSQLMFGEHVKHKEMAETLMLVYTAKKRAEVAPGVGEKTDMIVIGPELGHFTHVGEPAMAELRTTYNRVRKQAQKVRENGNAKIAKFIERAIGEPALEDPAPNLIEPGTVDGPAKA
ncbi:hypothetical protein SAMN05421771_2926 [Granulicella pectinivorans]|uniref:20S proteasome, alpha and beta subunits n=1 Tax=Granulicella pectinivorans TaxID=474950 RepID=A0A1I6MLB5_9BACT|nr:hypothetical protein [Granulicella pectinivorans]SFS16516.1 hypothetical protein SAMN05421771_2926 [Granulicella pectinivorans]